MENEKEASALMKGEEGKLLVLPEFRKYDLNIRQAKFAQMKSYGYNNTEAARAAGYSKAYAYQIGFNLMTNEKVVEYIKFLEAHVIYTHGVSKNMLVQELIRIKNLALAENKYSQAITAIKAVANLCGMDNGKNPEQDSTSNNSTTEVNNNYLVNFTKAIPEEKREIMLQENINPSLDFQVLEDFTNSIPIEDIAEKAIRNAKQDLQSDE